MSHSDEASLQKLFASETQKRLELVFSTIDDFKKGNSDLSPVKTTLHTIKGSANMMGLEEAARKAHEAEELLNSPLTPQSPDFARLERVLGELEALIGEREAERKESAPVTVAVAETVGSISILQRLLGTVAKLESLVKASAETKKEPVIESEVRRLRELTFQTVFAPAHQLFLGLDSVAQSVSTSHSKRVVLHCRASTDQILRDYLTELRGALVHLVSNSVVHGIEAPQDRVDKGKEPEGRLTVELFQDERVICLEVHDDGGGVNLDNLRRSYEKENRKEPWETLELEEKVNLLFETGRSLRDIADHHAGRGVGLAAVRESVHRLNGRVFFKPVDQGTCLRIEVPSPFFLSRCLIVRSCGKVFGLAASSIDKVQVLEGEQPALSILGLAFGYEVQEAEKPGYVVWCKNNVSSKKSVQKGFLISDCHGISEILGYALPAVSHLSPSAFGVASWNSQTIFLVDLEDLQTEADSGRRATQKYVPRADDEGRRVLVVDDSVTTRTILLDVLRRNGYSVDQAVDGRDAQARLAEKPFDLVVCDLEMPNLNGLEFLEWLRAEDSPYPSLPFVLFTSRDDYDSFQKARLLGADRCLGKGDFQEAKFLQIVSRLL